MVIFNQQAQKSFSSATVVNCGATSRAVKVKRPVIFTSAFMDHLVTEKILRVWQVLRCYIRGRKSHVLWRHCHPESFCAPGKFLRVTMKSTIKRHAKMQRFPDGLETIQMAWKLSRWPGNFPDGLETFQMARKLSRCSGNFPDGLETFQMV